MKAKVHFAWQGEPVEVEAEELVVGGIRFMLHDHYKIRNIDLKPERVKSERAISRAGVFMHSFPASEPSARAYMRGKIQELCGAGDAFKPNELATLLLNQLRRYSIVTGHDDKFYRAEERRLLAEMREAKEKAHEKRRA